MSEISWGVVRKISFPAAQPAALHAAGAAFPLALNAQEGSYDGLLCARAVSWTQNIVMRGPTLLRFCARGSPLQRAAGVLAKRRGTRCLRSPSLRAFVGELRRLAQDVFFVGG